MIQLSLLYKKLYAIKCIGQYSIFAPPPCAVSIIEFEIGPKVNIYFPFFLSYVIKIAQMSHWHCIGAYFVSNTTNKYIIFNIYP